MLPNSAKNPWAVHVWVVPLARKTPGVPSGMGQVERMLTTEATMSEQLRPKTRRSYTRWHDRLWRATSWKMKVDPTKERVAVNFGSSARVFA